MKIFLDDDRIPEDVIGWMHLRIGRLNPIYLRDDWTIIRSYREFIDVVSGAFNSISHISLDHDLADKQHINEDREDYREKTGYDAALWLKGFYSGLKKPLPYIFVHTMNPVGRQKIESVFAKSIR